MRGAAGRDVRGSLRKQAVRGGGAADSERRAADRVIHLLRQRETCFVGIYKSIAFLALVPIGTPFIGDQ